MRITVINGPNLNLLGTRQPEIYGHTTLEEINRELAAKFQYVQFSFFQSNIEGELVNIIQQALKNNDAIVINAGAYTHTSVAIGDALANAEIPVIEVHISNIAKRENFRHHSFVSSHATGSIIGLGKDGYALAVMWLLQNQHK